MSEPAKNPFDLLVDQIRAVVREEIKAALNGNGNGHEREPNSLLKLKDAAQRLNQSESWVYRHWKELGGKKLGGNIRFSTDDIEKFIAKRGAGA
jgi:predicted DNA-binding transcriptional regulator AlpA